VCHHDDRLIFGIALAQGGGGQLDLGGQKKVSGPFTSL
jgi:hypothetical protein